MTRVAGRDVDYAARTRRARGREGALRMAGVQRAVVHPLHVAARPGSPKGVQRDTGRLRGRAGASMKHIFCAGAGETMFHDQRHRLGRRPFVHRLRPAASTARRRSCTKACRSGPIRGSGGRSSQEHKVADDVHLAHSDPRTEEAGPVVHEQVRPVVACATCSSPASRSTSRPRAGRRTRSACRSSTTTGRPRPAGRSSRRSPGVEDTPRKFGSPVVPGLRLRREARRTSATGRRGGRRRERRAVHRAAAAARVHDHRLGRRRALRRRRTTRRFPASWCTRRSTGRRATRTATTSCWAAPTT